MRQVSDNAYVIEHAFTNCYVIVKDGAVTLVDACYPGTWPKVRDGLTSIGRSVADVAGLLLTHGHFDHVGFARVLHDRFSIPVWIHENDRWLAAHPYRYRPQSNRLVYPLRHPRSVPVLARMVSAGALRVRGIAATTTFRCGELDLPGSPVAVPTPGHTDGHCAFHFPTLDLLLSGDALVTLDPYTGRRGPRMVAPAATANLDLNRQSLTALASCDARVVGPGHGPTWRDGSVNAVRLAQRAVYD